ncbi:MAG: M48 family metallopeptidase, partial [Burkholderiales bacterium]|nr:M48 family metallopeptidase [Opitutaceae bacterium]
MKPRLLALLIGSLALLFLPACTTVEETGRKQFNFMSDDQIASMGVDAFSQIKQQEKISKDPAVNARIQRIGKRVAGAVGRDLPNAQWEFVVFDSDQLNAFALPGGKVGFYTGLINLAANDDEIAIVMGHEVAHVTSRHGAERQSQAIAIGLGAVALGVGTNNDKNQEYYMLAYGVGSTLGSLAYSRSHETEADVVGLRFAAKAGYDPRAAASFWRKMAAKETGGRPPQLLSTHPSSQERIQNLERLAVELMPVYEQAKANLAAGGAPAAPVPPAANVG